MFKKILWLSLGIFISLLSGLVIVIAINLIYPKFEILFVGNSYASKLFGFFAVTVIPIIIASTYWKKTRFFSYGLIFGLVLFCYLYNTYIYRSLSGEMDDKTATYLQLSSNAYGLVEYKDKYGRYPEDLKDKCDREYPETLDEFRACIHFTDIDGYSHPLYYRVSSDGQSYELRSLGPDGKYGTKDDILAPQLPTPK